MKIAIYGYGNLGRGVEAAVAHNHDTELLGIFTRRDPKEVNTVTGAPVYSANDVLKFKSEIDVLRREVENALYTQTALVRSRGDIMRLFEKSRNIMDILNDSLFQFEIETPFIPSELNPEFMKLTEFSTLAVEAIVPAAKAYFKAPDTVPDKISRSYFYEKEALRYSQTIKRTVFHNMTSLKLSEKFHLRYFALHIENLSKAAANVADQLAVMAIRRTM